MDESLFENDEQTDDVEDPLAIPSLAQTVEESESGRRVSVDTPSGSFADEDSNPYPALRDQSQGEGGGDAHDKFLGYSMYDQLPRSGDQAFHVKRPKCGGRGKMFKCSNCTKAYPIKASLKRHLRSGLCVRWGTVGAGSPQVQTFQCRPCGQSFARKQLCDVHKRLHCSVEMNEGMDDSDAVASGAADDSVLFHAVDHPIKLETECFGEDVPGESSVAHGGHTGHNVDHVNAPAEEAVRAVEARGNSSVIVPNSPIERRNYECVFCEKTFNEKSKLAVHLGTHSTPLLPKSFKCDVCGRTFRTLWTFSRHQCVHEEIAFICDLCPQKFSTKQNVLDHLAVAHKVRCPLCTRTFGEEKYLEEHLAECHFKQMVGADSNCLEGELQVSAQNSTSDALTFLEIPLEYNKVQDEVLEVDSTGNEDSSSENSCGGMPSPDAVTQNSPDASTSHSGDHKGSDEGDAPHVSAQLDAAACTENLPERSAPAPTDVQETSLPKGTLSGTTVSCTAVACVEGHSIAGINLLCT